MTWGDPTSGGKSSKVAQELKAGVSSASLPRIVREREGEREILFLLLGGVCPVQICADSNATYADQGVLRNNGRRLGWPGWIV